MTAFIWNFIEKSGVQILVCFGACIAFGIVYNIHPKHLFLGALGGTIGWIFYLLPAGLFANDVPQYFIAAAFIAAFSEIMARITKTPAVVFLLPALFPLVPGGTIYYTMETCLTGTTEEFLAMLTYTFEVAGCIALGVFSSASLVSIITSSMLKFHMKKKNLALARHTAPAASGSPQEYMATQDFSPPGGTPDVTTEILQDDKISTMVLEELTTKEGKKTL